MPLRPIVVGSVRRVAERLGYRVERIDRGAPRSVISDTRVTAVLDRLHSLPQRPDKPNDRGDSPSAYAEFPFGVDRTQGNLIYLLCRSLGARRVVDVATSLGISTIYLAAAVRDNGGGIVIGSEIVPAKVAAARRNVADAGLAEQVEIREGDAPTELRDLGDSVDVVIVDAWGPRHSVGISLAREVVEFVTPQLRVGGIAINDNGESDYLAFVRNPANGFRSMSLPLKAGSELSVRVPPE